MITKKRILIGIDPGTNTGMAVYDRNTKKLTSVLTVGIVSAMDAVKVLNDVHAGGIFLRIEDARKRKWIKKTGPEILQGVGSVKRDASIWQEFVEKHGIEAEFIAPIGGMTKWSEAYFQKITGWEGRTSNHARDASALVFGN